MYDIPSECAHFKDSFRADGLGEKMEELSLRYRYSDIGQSLIFAVLQRTIQRVVLWNEERIVVRVRTCPVFSGCLLSYPSARHGLEDKERKRWKTSSILYHSEPGQRITQCMLIWSSSEPFNVQPRASQSNWRTTTTKPKNLKLVFL